MSINRCNLGSDRMIACCAVVLTELEMERQRKALDQVDSGVVMSDAASRNQSLFSEPGNTDYVTTAESRQLMLLQLFNTDNDGDT